MQKSNLIKVANMPEGMLLTESGYDVIRLNGDSVIGYVNDQGRYYEHVEHPDGTYEWFTEQDDFNMANAIFGGVGFC